MRIIGFETESLVEWRVFWRKRVVEVLEGDFETLVGFLLVGRGDSFWLGVV